MSALAAIPYLDGSASAPGLSHNPYHFLKVHRACASHGPGGKRSDADLIKIGDMVLCRGIQDYPPACLKQLLIGQSGYNTSPVQVLGLIETYAPDTVVLNVEQHWKQGQKPSGAFFVTVVAGTEGPLLALHQRIRFLIDGVISYESNDLATYGKPEMRRILSFRNRRGEIRDHLPVYRMTVECKGVKGSPLPDFERTELGQEILKELFPGSG